MSPKVKMLSVKEGVFISIMTNRIIIYIYAYETLNLDARHGYNFRYRQYKHLPSSYLIKEFTKILATLHSELISWFNIVLVQAFNPIIIHAQTILRKLSGYIYISPICALFYRYTCGKSPTNLLWMVKI